MKVEEKDFVLKTIADGGLPEQVAKLALLVLKNLRGHKTQAMAAKKVVAAFKRGGEAAAIAMLDRMAAAEVEFISSHPLMNPHARQRAMRERFRNGKPT